MFHSTTLNATINETAEDEVGRKVEHAPESPRLCVIRFPAGSGQIDFPSCHIGKRDRGNQQPRPKHVLLRREIRRSAFVVHARPLGDICVGKTKIHEERAQDHSARFVKCLEDRR